MKKTQKRTGIIALVLLCLFALSIAIISLYSTGITFASAVTDGDNIYSATNTYNASVETRNEIIDGISYEYEFATYNLKARSNGAKVSNDLPQVTFITHGLSGNAGHWSNNGSTGDFCYMENSVIEFLKQKAECNVYVAQFYNGMQYNLYKLPETNYVKAQYAAYKVEKIIDNTRHSIVVFEAYSPNGTNDFIYAQFDKMASTVVSQLAELDSKHELPRVNLIGHSRGGITNMQYALDHPDLVDSIYSIATPYVGSTSADIDMYLLQGAFSGTPGESDIINHDIYMEYMDRWNEGYSNNLYSDIKVHAIGGYESLDTLVYSLLVNYINSHDLDVLLRVGLKAAICCTEGGTLKVPPLNFFKKLLNTT